MEVDDATKEFIVDNLAAFTYRYCMGCGVLIQKDGGCNYVKCVVCGTEICWQCGLQKYIALGCNNKAHDSH